MPKPMKTNGADERGRTVDLLITNQQALEPIHGPYQARIFILKHLSTARTIDARIESIHNEIHLNPSKLDDSRKSTHSLVVRP